MWIIFYSFSSDGHDCSTADYRAIIFMMKKKLCVNARIICVIYDLKYHEIFFLFLET